jgi:ribosomal protein S21
MSQKKKSVKSIGLEVFVNNTGDAKKDRAAVDVALREFKKRIKKSEIMNELREREAYMTPSKYKRYRKNEAIKRRKRDSRKSQWSKTDTFDI